WPRDWSSDVCSSDLEQLPHPADGETILEHVAAERLARHSKTSVPPFFSAASRRTNDGFLRVRGARLGRKRADVRRVRRHARRGALDQHHVAIRVTDALGEPLPDRLLRSDELPE